MPEPETRSKAHSKKKGKSKKTRSRHPPLKVESKSQGPSETSVVIQAQSGPLNAPPPAPPPPPPPQPPPSPNMMNPCFCCCCTACNLRTNCIVIGILSIINGLYELHYLKHVIDEKDCGQDTKCKSQVTGAHVLTWISAMIQLIPGILLLVAAFGRSKGATSGAMAIFVFTVVFKAILCLFLTINIRTTLDPSAFSNADKQDGDFLINLFVAFFVISFLIGAAINIYFALCSYALGKQIEAGVDTLPHNPGGRQVADGLPEAPPPGYSPSHTQSSNIYQQGSNPYTNKAPQQPSYGQSQAYPSSSSAPDMA